MGTKFEFEFQARGPGGATLTATLLAAKSCYLLAQEKYRLKSRRAVKVRPPYELVYIYEKDFDASTRWGAETWNTTHAGAFADPTARKPLTLCINQDFGLLRTYLPTDLSEKKADEHRMEEKKTKYVSHVAYHLYQYVFAQR